ncbi:MAG: hypothetical protein MI867_17585 [Pseudomonadales bacterium]|nr:hypothetical protein [Pseudomonadales bacterium]
MVDVSEIQETVEFERGRPDIYGAAHPKALLRAIQEDGDYLKDLSNQHVITIDQFEPITLLQLFRLAAKYESNPDRFTSPLQGKILISAFYEPSTRTRLSFESAWHRLGGDIMSITDRSTTGIAKGESLADVGEMFNNYCDCVVLRDNKEESLHQMMDTLRVPIINAGNGIDEHPTQALADMYTIFKWRPDLMASEVPEYERINVGVIGVPGRMRTVRSLLKVFTKFSSAFKKITIIHDENETDIFSPGQREELEDAGIDVNVVTSLEEVICQLDVVYINAIAWVGDSFESHGSKFHLHKDLPFKENAIVMHPLARGEELDTNLDETHHNWYFAQARGAVFLRMALLTCMVQRTSRVMDVI